MISKMSGVGIEISSGKLPIRGEVYEVAEVIGKSPVELALASGEEFELLFTVPPERFQSLKLILPLSGRSERETEFIWAESRFSHLVGSIFRDWIKLNSANVLKGSH